MTFGGVICNFSDDVNVEEEILIVNHLSKLCVQVSLIYFFN